MEIDVRLRLPLASSSVVCTSAYFNGGKSDSATCFEPRRGGGERDVTPGISDSWGNRSCGGNCPTIVGGVGGVGIIGVYI